MIRKRLPLIGPIFLALATVLLFGYSLTRAQVEQQTLESAAVGTTFTYQGRLNDGGVPADGNYDFEFGLYDALTIGSQVGITVPQTIAVTDGLFTTALDFGAGVFNGDPRYLEIAVKLSGGGGYTSLIPRQPLTAVPYASYADKVQPLENVVNVAKSGGDYTSVQDALDNISASASNRYLIRIAPGIYDGTVDLESYVDIEGSGEGVTTLRGLGSNSNDSSAATLRANSISDVEVRLLTVESDGTGNGWASAIWNENTGTTLRFTHVTASASGASNNYGIFNESASPTMNHITANASSGTVFNYAIYNSVSSSTMNNITASASGASNCYGIYNSTTSPTMNNVTVSVSGCTSKTYGVYNDGASSTMNIVTISTSDASDNYGIYNVSSNMTMDNVTATASGGAASNYGIFNTSGATPIIRNSALTGATNSIANEGGASAMVDNAVLDGAVSVGAGLSCLDSRDGNGQALDTGCGPIAVGDAVTWEDIANVPPAVANVVWVATSGGDYTSVQDALDNISASASNPYLIRVAPGVYTGTVDLESYVDIEGSGEGTTILRGLGGNTSPSSNGSSATVRASGVITAEVRWLTVESDGTGQSYATAIWTSGASAALHLTHVSATASGGTNDNYGVYNEASSPTMNNVSATASGGISSFGVYNKSSSPTMNNVIFNASGGTNNNFSVYNDASSPTMNNVTVTASGGSINVGFFNTSASSPTINNVTITASGGTNTFGVDNNNSSPTMNNVTATAKDGTSINYGVRNTSSSSPTMNNVTATASGGTNNYGVWNSSSSVAIRESMLAGSTNSITNSGGSALVANTMLAGPVAGAATYTCFNTYDAAFAAVVCP